MNEIVATMLNQQITDALAKAARLDEEITDRSENLTSMTPTLLSAGYFNDIRSAVSEIERLALEKESCERSIEAFRAALNA